MAAFRRGVLFLPQMGQVRCRSKINIQRPRPRHDPRRLFEAITKPIILPEPISHMEVCARRRAKVLETQHEVNPYEEFLLKQCKKMLNENRLVAVCQALPMSAKEKNAARNKLMKNGLKVLFFSNSVMRRALEDSVMVNMRPYIIGHNLYVVNEEPLLEDLVKVLRKIPELILLGARVDDQLLSKEAILACTKLPSLEILRGELVSILGHPASRSRSLIGKHQQTLAMNLDQYMKQSKEGESSSPLSADGS